MSKAQQMRLVMSLVNGVSGPAKAIGADLKRLRVATNTLVSSTMAPSRAVAGLGRGMRRAAYDMAGISAPIGLAAGAAGRAVFQYEKMGNAMEAVGQLTDDQREKLEAYSKELNFDFPFTNKEILSAAFELGRAGQSFDQVMGSLRSTLNVSLAGDMGLQRTADIMTNVAQAMRLPIETVAESEETMRRVGDVLAYGATNSNTSIEEMGVTFKYVAPLAAATGMSLEEMAAATMMLANNGIKGSNAGTGLRFALARLLSPSKAAQKALNRLNIDLADFVTGARKIDAGQLIDQLAIDGIDASGLASAIDATLNDPAIMKSPAKLTAALSKLIGEELGEGVVDSVALSDSLSEALAVLGSQIDFKGLLRELRNNPDAEALLPTIFGKRHGAKIMALLAADLNGAIADMLDNAEGAADRMSKIRMKGIVGEVARLTAAFETLAITVADAGVLTTVTDALKSITSVTSDLARANPRLLETATYAALAVAAIVPASLALSGLAGAAGLLVNPLTWVAAGLAAFSYSNWSDVIRFARTFKNHFLDAIDPAVIDGIGRAFNRLGNWLGELTGLTTGMDWVYLAQDWGRGLAEAINTAYNVVTEKGQAILDWLDGLGVSGEALAAFGGSAVIFVGGMLGLGLAAGAVRSVGRALLFLSGVKLAWGVLRFLGRLIKLGGKAGDLTKLGKAVRGLFAGTAAVGAAAAAGSAAGDGKGDKDKTKGGRSRGRGLLGLTGIGAIVMGLYDLKDSDTFTDFLDARTRKRQIERAIQEVQGEIAKSISVLDEYVDSGTPIHPPNPRVIAEATAEIEESQARLEELRAELAQAVDALGEAADAHYGTGGTNEPEGPHRPSGPPSKNSGHPSAGVPSDGSGNRRPEHQGPSPVVLPGVGPTPADRTTPASAPPTIPVPYGRPDRNLEAAGREMKAQIEAATETLTTAVSSAMEEARRQVSSIFAYTETGGFGPDSIDVAVNVNAAPAVAALGTVESRTSTTRAVLEALNTLVVRPIVDSSSIAQARTAAVALRNTLSSMPRVGQSSATDVRRHMTDGGVPKQTFGGARARGGPIKAGMSYLVGERGPEVVTPSRDGFVHPNGGGGGTPLTGAGGGGVQIGTLHVHAKGLTAREAAESFMGELHNVLTRSREVSLQGRPITES